MSNIYFLGYDISYYFLGRMGFVVYVKNNFLQKIGKWSLHLLQIDAVWPSLSRISVIVQSWQLRQFRLYFLVNFYISVFLMHNN